jgi:hypothetical protein
MSDAINIIGIDLGELVAALHNGTRAIGFGSAQDLGRDMTPEEARDEAPLRIRNGVISFDYFHGRPMKVTIDVTLGELRNAGLYDRDASGGDGACQKAVDLARSRSPGNVEIESVVQKQIAE